MNSSGKDVICSPDDTILHVLEGMSASHVGIVAVTDDAGVLLGIVVDGDIRRSILKRVDLDSPISAIMNPTPMRIEESMTEPERQAFVLANRRNAYPGVSGDGVFTRFYYLSEFTEPRQIDNRAVILAGGFGKRLRPYTDNCPKPMLRIGSKPLVEKIVDGLVEDGLSNISMLLHYMPEVFLEYFDDKRYLGRAIDFVEERTPRGTAGGLALLREKLDRPFLVLNGDNIITADWPEVLGNHERGGYDITIGSSDYSTTVPFAVLDVRDGIVESITEKPTYSWRTVCSSYCLSPSVLDHVPEDRAFDMPDLIAATIEAGGKVGVFTVQSYERIEDLADSHKLHWHHDDRN